MRDPNKLQVTLFACTVAGEVDVRVGDLQRGRFISRPVGADLRSLITGLYPLNVVVQNLGAATIFLSFEERSAAEVIANGLEIPPSFQWTPYGIFPIGATSSVPVIGVDAPLQSSNTPLAGGASFTGPWEEMTNYTNVVVTFIADAGAAFNGIQLQWSSDGINVDVIDIYNMLFLGVGQAINLPVRGRYFRVVYTNGGGAQGYFRLHTTYKYGTEVFTVDAYMLGDTGKRAAVQSYGDSIPVLNRILVENAGRVLDPNTGLFDWQRKQVAGLHVNASGALGAAVTATLPAAGVNFHYISSILIQKLYNVVGVAAAAGVVITTTNLPGAPAWITEQLAKVAGTVVDVVKYEPVWPLKSAVAGVATTIVCPAEAETIWYINVSYSVGV